MVAITPSGGGSGPALRRPSGVLVGHGQAVRPAKCPRRIVVIGGGIAGSTLAILLTRAGHHVCVIDLPTRTDILVGETLIPATTRLIQSLGIEEEVRQVAQVKRGAAFIMRDGRALELPFWKLTGVTSTYTYNVPRPAFDELFRTRAAAEGVRVVHHRARVEVSGEDRVLLDRDTLDACSLQSQPDLVVDCSGRAQVVRRALGLHGRAGKRRDTALFAHFTGVDHGVEIEGASVLTTMQAGWSWRIPLRDRMSVGVVLDTPRLRAHGETPEAQLEHALRSDPIMAPAMEHAGRVSAVKTYTNYQWIMDRFVGANWVLAGDAAGFVDPALSSGVFLAIQASTRLAQVLAQRAETLARRLADWERDYRANLTAWHYLVDTYYDGHLFANILTGKDLGRIPWLRPIHRHLERNATGVIMGARTMSPYSRRLVRFLMDRPRGHVPAQLAIA